MSERLEWRIADQSGVTQVTLNGPVNEDADFAPLSAELRDRQNVRFDMAGISRINSCGVREWVNFIRSLTQISNIELEKCTPAVVSQLNMISNFAGSARILSVHAPFVCEQCGSESDVLIAVERGSIPTLAETKCKSCGGTMEFDDIEDSYFAFLS